MLIVFSGDMERPYNQPSFVLSYYLGRFIAIYLNCYFYNILTSFERSANLAILRYITTFVNFF